MRSSYRGDLNTISFIKPILTTPKNFGNATIAGHFGFAIKENSGREKRKSKKQKPGQGNHMFIVMSSFSRSSVFKMFSVGHF